MKVKDIKKPSKADAENFLRSHSYSVATVDQFRKLMVELGELFSVPYHIIEDIAELECGFPTKPHLLKSNSFEVSKSFRGPFQIGEDHWTDSVKFAKQMGFSFPSSRLAASLGQQAFATLSYMRVYGDTYPKVGAQPLDLGSVYLIHNQGAPAANIVFSGKTAPSWLRANASGQSGKAKQLLKRYSL